MLGIIRLAANFPQVRLHGLFATGLILLSREVLLVRGDLVQIALTSLHSSCHSGEASTSIQLIGRQRSGTFVDVGLADVQAGAVRALRSSGTVGAGP